MTIKNLELDRSTFDFIQKNLAANGHEAAAGYMVNLAVDLGRQFTTRKITVSLNAFKCLHEQNIDKLVEELNKSL